MRRFLQVLIFFLSSLSARAGVEDLSRHLELTGLSGFRVTDENGNRVIASHAVYEFYPAFSRHGLIYQLMIPPGAAEIVEAIALSQFMEILAMPRNAVSVSFIQRGKNEFLTYAEAKARFPQDVITGSPDHPDEWLPVLLYPFRPVDTDLEYEGGRPISVKQLADATCFLIFAHTFGTGKPSPWPLLLGDDLVTTQALGLFTGYTKKAMSGTLREFLKNYPRDFLPVRQLKAIVENPDDFEKYVDHVNRFLGELEALAVSNPKLGKTTAEKILAPFLDLTQLPNKFSGLLTLLKNIRAARSQLVASVGGIHPAFRAAFSAPSTSPVSLNPILFEVEKLIPRYSDEVPKFESGWEYRAKTFLWQYALGNSDTRRKFETGWAKQRNTTSPITEILAAATQYDNSKFLISRIPLSQILRDGDAGEFQWILNESLAKMLLVAAPGDPESESVISLTERMMLVVNQDRPRLALYPDFLEETDRFELSRSQYRKILKDAQDGGFSNVGICELGEIPPEWVAEAKLAGISITHLDHHMKNEFKLSAIELLAQMFGYRLSLYDLVIAILDRSGVAGLSALGADRREVRQILYALGRLRRIEKVAARLRRQMPTARLTSDILYRVQQPSGRLFHVMGPLGFIHYPRAPHVLIEGAAAIRFCGPYETCEDLRLEFAPQIAGRWVWGGDLDTGYVFFYPRHRDLIAGYVERFEAKLNKLHPYPCAIILEEAMFRP